MEVAEESWSWAEATGDARFSVLWRTLWMADRWFGDGEGGAVATTFLKRVDAVIKRELPGVLEADSAELGTALAVTMRDQLVAEVNLAGDVLMPSYGHDDPDT
jgi:hypothetical protein